MPPPGAFCWRWPMRGLLHPPAVPEPASHTCPADTVVALFVEGGLDPSERPGIEAHLDGCAGCRRLFAAVAREAGAASATGAGTATDETSAPTRDERRGRSRAADADADAAVPIGHTVGRYIIVQPVGRGAMGTVYLARDPSLDRR